MDYQGNNVRDFLNANGHVVLKRVDNNYNLKSFSQKEIEDITNGYYTVLGEGGFGKVYKGKLDDLRPVAVKRYKNGTNKEEFAREVIVHSQINHKNVVRLLGCCTEENSLMIVMEFVCNGNLENILHCSNANVIVPFPLEQRLDIAIESAEVLSCMHSMFSPVLHGDIKPANILLDENFRPKISDFGIARLLAAEGNQYTRSVIGCIGYMDPLFCQSGILTPKSDVYSFGVVLLEIITRKKAVDGNIILAQSFAEALRKGKKVRRMFDEEIANDRKNMKLLDNIAKLADECLKMEEKMRPEMVEVADRLRTVRKAFHQRKGRNSTGSNIGLTRTALAENVISPTPATSVTLNNNDNTLPSTVPTISMDELQEITGNFSNDALIGQGSSSKVFFGVLKDGHMSAIKKFNPTKNNILEIPVVSRFKHRNVVQLLGYCVEGDNRVLAYEHTSRGSLHDILHGKRNVIGAEPGMVLSWAERVNIALSAATGLEFLHKKARPCIVHGHIKSSNILLFGSDVAKIGGIGVSHAPSYIDNTFCRICSGYESPEYLLKGQFSTKDDVYSFGVVLLELLTGRKVFDATLPRDQQRIVTWATPRLSKDMQQCVDRRLGGKYPPGDVTKEREQLPIFFRRKLKGSIYSMAIQG
ncbi:uncharacterized protein [Lolium perenne]|uniref:uncharacterized protein n=1 Tax=Lolium perenne TaxID=4522 RepID=UPI003A98D42E